MVPARYFLIQTRQSRSLGVGRVNWLFFNDGLVAAGSEGTLTVRPTTAGTEEGSGGGLAAICSKAE